MGYPNRIIKGNGGDGQKVLLSIRPERIELGREGGSDNLLKTRVIDSVYQGIIYVSSLMVALMILSCGSTEKRANGRPERMSWRVSMPLTAGLSRHDGSVRQNCPSDVSDRASACFHRLVFLWPLGVMMKQAVSDTAVLRVLPQTADAVSLWDGQSPPSPEMKQALVTDLKASTDQQAIGDMVRRLNSAQSGFRTLMSKTLSAIEKDDPVPDLETIDKRWSRPEFWQAIASALSPTTDRNLLAAVDMERDTSGEIVSMAQGTSANRAIMLRTFWIAALVTLACAAIGYPYAVLLASSKGWVRNVLLPPFCCPSGRRCWCELLPGSSSCRTRGSSMIR